MIILQTVIEHSATDKLIEFIFKSSVIDSAVSNLIAKVVIIATVLAAIFYFITLAINYVKVLFDNLKDKSAEFFVDYKELAYTVLIIGAIVIYLPIANVLMSSMDYFNAFTAPGTQQNEMLGKYAQNYVESGVIWQAKIEEGALKEMANSPDSTPEERAWARKELENRGKNPSTKSTPSNVEEKSKVEDGAATSESSDSDHWWNFLNPKTWGPAVISAIIAFLTSLIRIVIASITINVLKVLFCIGPLAFAFSILPVFRNQISIWFGTVINCGLVFTTMNIIDHLSYATMNYFYRSGFNYDSPETTNSLVAFNLSLLVLYTMCFWLTSKYVGKGDAGRVLSKTIGMAAAVIGGAAMAGGASGGAGKASNVANAAEVGKNIISGE